MIQFFSPKGHDWVSGMNLDGYGISQIVFAVVYSALFYAACGYVWTHRNHPVIKMRKISLALLSILLLHVYLFMVLLVYPLNSAFPCSVEFWIMSIYLPIGIGLFQAQNQQLLIVSREQNNLIHTAEYKPLYHGHGKGVGGPKYWFWRLKLWWQGASTQGKYEAFVLVGMVLQFLVSVIIYCISRKFNAYGLVSGPVSPGLCRRGWEWLPSIVWQLLWNYLFGPYLLWKIRMIHDVYHWRLQTTLAVIAGLPGTPFWLAAVYTDAFASVNKWWVPAMWFAPGLITMELTTLIFPILQILKHKTLCETPEALTTFDTKQFELDSAASSSSPSSPGGRMFSMESLELCLTTNHDGLQIYASCMELNGENIIFLTKVLEFQKQWHTAFSGTNQLNNTLMILFRAALSIYIQLVHTATATYPINIESHIYAQLEATFGPATALMAATRRSSEPLTPVSSAVTPWEDATPTESPNSTASEFPMHTMPSRPASRRNESSEHLALTEESQDLNDPLANIVLPKDFNQHVFNEAYKSIKFMVWSEIWQRYMIWRRTSGSSTA